MKSLYLLGLIEGVLIMLFTVHSKHFWTNDLPAFPPGPVEVLGSPSSARETSCTGTRLSCLVAEGNVLTCRHIARRLPQCWPCHFYLLCVTHGVQTVQNESQENRDLPYLFSHDSESGDVDNYVDSRF